MQFAKGITSGYVPLGGIGVSDAIREVINGVPAGQALDARLHLLGTSRRAARWRSRNLDIIEREGLVERAADERPRGCSRSCGRLESMDGVGHVRGLGLMAAVEVVADKTTKQLFPPQARSSRRSSRTRCSSAGSTRAWRWTASAWRRRSMTSDAAARPHRRHRWARRFRRC